MPNSDKNILIIPSVGANVDPQIIFTGADANSNGTIVLFAYPESNGTLSFEGSAGQLFSITNDLSGTIFSVNDISGIPSIEVLDTGLIKLAQYSGNVAIGQANANSKLDVLGDVNVSGVYKIGGVIVLTSTTISDIQNINTTQNTNIGSAFTQANTAGTNAISAFNQANTALNKIKTYTTDFGNGTLNPLSINHNLSSNNLIITIKETATGNTVYPDISQTNSNYVLVTFVSAPSTNQYNITILGY